MTNAEKYLKDGVDIEELIATMEEELPLSYVDVAQFWEKTIKPTLTEDERVILRNIQKGLFRKGFISRAAGNELFVFIKETGETIELYIFNHLFQFIKERRRILNRRIA